MRETVGPRADIPMRDAVTGGTAPSRAGRSDGAPRCAVRRPADQAPAPAVPPGVPDHTDPRHKLEVNAAPPGAGLGFRREVTSAGSSEGGDVADRPIGEGAGCAAEDPLDVGAD